MVLITFCVVTLIIVSAFFKDIPHLLDKTRGSIDGCFAVATCEMPTCTLALSALCLHGMCDALYTVGLPFSKVLI